MADNCKPIASTSAICSEINLLHSTDSTMHSTCSNCQHEGKQKQHCLMVTKERREAKIKITQPANGQRLTEKASAILWHLLAKKYQKSLINWGIPSFHY